MTNVREVANISSVYVFILQGITLLPFDSMSIQCLRTGLSAEPVRPSAVDLYLSVP